jgi:AmiR/NasT family two-component response regulator
MQGSAVHLINVASMDRLHWVSRTPYRVVIAEDEALIRLDLKEMLEEPGQDAYVVVGEASDGDTAVKLAADLKPDLVIMDVKMPVLDGISAAEQITARRLAPVVILTAFSQRDLVQRASSAGAMAYLVKPFTKADLIPAIEIAVSRFAEFDALQTEVGDLRQRLEMRKLLDRAKGVLQASRGISEPEAFRWIQKTSMDRRMTMRALAQEIIDEHQRGANSASHLRRRPDPSSFGQASGARSLPPRRPGARSLAAVCCD